MTSQPPEPVTLPIPVDQVCPRLWVHNRPETVSNFVRSFRVWQRHITVFMIDYLQPGDSFVDIGANLGYFSVYAGLCVGDSGVVQAIEPDADNAALLARNAELNRLSNIRLHRTAISDYIGDATLYQGSYNAGSHSILEKDDLSAGPSVPVTTLDELLAGAETPRLIKIDVQGAELSVLRGMRQLLATAKRKPGIIMEFSPLDLQRNGEMEDFFAFVADNSYSLRAFIDNERKKNRPPQLRRATLREIAKDIITASDDAEFDILLLAHP